MKLSHRSRSLRCIVSGRVVSLGELRGEPWGSRCGYAVLRRRKSNAELLMIRLLQRILPKYAERLSNSTVEITAPVNGVVISVCDGRMTLRTGDGIPVTAAIGEGVSFIPEVGHKVCCNDVICRTRTRELEANGANGEVAVFFPDPSMITELHIFTGHRRSTYRTLFYRVQKIQ